MLLHDPPQVDLTHFDPDDVMGHPITADQISACDVLVASKADAVTNDVVDACMQWAGQLYPPKAQVSGVLFKQSEPCAYVKYVAVWIPCILSTKIL